MKISTFFLARVSVFFKNLISSKLQTPLSFFGEAFYFYEMKITKKKKKNQYFYINFPFNPFACQ